MLIRAYDEFVTRTDLNKKQPTDKREDIGIYGLVGEIGALTAAVKRRIIAESGEVAWNTSTDEIKEELGDALWYLAFLSMIYDGSTSNVIKGDIRQLVDRLNGTGEDDPIFRDALGPEKVSTFLGGAARFSDVSATAWGDYQKLAYLTARTEGKTFLGVCLTVLAQLGAELLRRRFPDLENRLNTIIPKRQLDVILGETAWHLAAVASIFNVSLDEVALQNTHKINSRVDRTKKTPLHDRKCKEHERFPRKFRVSFVTIGNGRSRMYFDGKRLGDELTDNFYEDDGYRFHDVMHLANAVHLGWSPVLRSLIGAKRKSDKKKDEIEDGARARIVEEAVIKAVHCEGVRIAKAKMRAAKGRPVQLFENDSDITFKFLSLIRTLVDKLEVSVNRDWEWVRAIMDGNRLYYELRREGQGTVDVDLIQRTIVFRPDVVVDVPGAVVGMGAATVDAALYDRPQVNRRSAEDFGWEKAEMIRRSYSPLEIATRVATKRAVLQALGFIPERRTCSSVEVKQVPEGLSVKTSGAVRERAWARRVVGFRAAVNRSGSLVTCSVVAVADPTDAAV